jgi:hypothetical protein
MVDHGREARTASHLAARLAQLPPELVRKIRVLRDPLAPLPSSRTAPPPTYASWDAYLSTTAEVQRRRWCARKANKANSGRLISGLAERRITADDVMAILERARGRCTYSGSLAVENRPRRFLASPTARTGIAEFTPRWPARARAVAPSWSVTSCVSLAS